MSLHLRARKSPVQVAAWAGHSQAVMFQHYAHVIEELDAEPELPVDAQILRAREVIAGLNQLQLDLFTAELLEHPTVAVAGDRSAASVLYGATGLELWALPGETVDVGFSNALVGADPSKRYAAPERGAENADA